MLVEGLRDPAVEGLRELLPDFRRFVDLRPGAGSSAAEAPQPICDGGTLVVRADDTVRSRHGPPD